MPGARSTPDDLRRFRLFLVSYAPLWVMLAFRAAPLHGWQWANHRTLLCVAFGVLALWSFLDALNLVSGAGETGSVRLWFSEIDDQGGNAAGYLATYLLPFIGLIPAGWGDWVAYGLFFAVAGVVFVRTNLALVNPTLYLLGWRVVAARAFLDERRSPDRQVGVGSVIVVCRRPKLLVPDGVDLVELAGCYIRKGEPRIKRRST